MKKIEMKLTHCYGIKKLHHTFDFNKGNLINIYASNGMMKTSLCDTLNDIHEGRTPVDALINDNKTICEIKIMPLNTVISKNDIFVIRSLDTDYRSKKISNLLVNKKMKDQYDNLYEQIEIEKKEIIRKLVNELKLKSEQMLANDLKELLQITNNNFFERLDILMKEESPVIPNNLDYVIIRNPKVTDFLNKSKEKQVIAKYVSEYKKVIASSDVFDEEKFTIFNLESIIDSVIKNNFFKSKCKNGIIINNDEFTNESSLKDYLENEKKQLLSNPQLKASFIAIEKGLRKNADIKQLHVLLVKNPEICVYLNDVEKLQKNIIINLLHRHKDQIDKLINHFHTNKNEINEIIKAAKEEETKWNEVIKIYNSRFDVPFVLEIGNMEDAVFRNEIPQLIFKYKSDEDIKKSVTEETMKKRLSQGEKRALYILNVIFEMENLISEGNAKLILIDDIADSFDYKNKYAIIEYLADFRMNQFFNIIILSHNFDLYRTIGSRLGSKNMVVHKDENEGLSITDFGYIKNVFESWLNGNIDDSIFISMIPFTRNVIEYVYGIESEDYEILTSLLHLKYIEIGGKYNTKEITINQVEKVYCQTFKRHNDLKYRITGNGTDGIFDFIISVANSIADKNKNDTKLENKLVLSIAIRLLAEEYMLKIIPKSELGNLKSNQTIHLFKCVKENNLADKGALKNLEQVILMTPENIHINSFMYEPLLDMSNHHLFRLFNNIKKLNNSVKEQE